MDLYQNESFLYEIQLGDDLLSLAQRYNTSINSIIYDNPGINPNSLNVGQVICIHPGYDMYFSTFQDNDMILLKYSKKEVELIRHIDMLWEQHVIWTRLTILSIVEDLPDVDAVTKRLLRNPKDFEIALSPFYGDKIAAEFAVLLTEHLTIAGQLVKAAKANNNAEVAEIERKWYENADSIACFLSRINPYWSREEWTKMLYEHLSLTKTEAVDIINKDFESSINIFDEIETQALLMAITMSVGIIRQFRY